MKNNVYPCKPQFNYIKLGFKGVKLYRHVFVMICGVFFVIVCSFTSFGASRRLCFVTVAFPGYLYFYLYKKHLKTVK